MDYELIKKSVDIINSKILTPVIYMSDHGDWVEFVCFCDGKIKMQELYDTELELKKVLNKDAEIIDIREFSEAERIEVIEQYELIHSENQIVEKILTASLLSDYHNLISEKQLMLNRKHELGTYYVQ